MQYEVMVMVAVGEIAELEVAPGDKFVRPKLQTRAKRKVGQPEANTGRWDRYARTMNGCSTPEVQRRALAITADLNEMLRVAERCNPAAVEVLREDVSHLVWLAVACEEQQGVVVFREVFG